MTQLLYAFLAILFKTLSKNGIPILQILWMRSVFISIASIIAIKISKQGKFFGPKRIWPYLASRAVFGSIGMSIYFASLPFIAIGDAVALSRLTAVFSVFFVCILGWETLNSLMTIGAIICTAGGVIILHPPLLFGSGDHWSQRELIGYSFALSSAILVALAYLFTAKIGTTMSETAISFSSHTPTAIVMGICLCFSFPSSPAWIDKKNTLLFCVFLPSIFLGNIMMTRGIQLCAGIQAATLQSTGIVFSYVLSFLILGEKMTLFGFVGAPIVGLGVWIQAYGKMKVKQDEALIEPEVSEDGSENTEV